MIHPEQAEDEVFLGNYCVYAPEGYTQCGWKTKRCGDIAYDRDGVVLYQSRPMFAKVSELTDYIQSNPNMPTSVLQHMIAEVMEHNRKKCK